MTPDRIIITDTAEHADSLRELPPWARAAAVIGIPGVIAMYLVYVLTTAVTAKLDAHAQESRAESAQQLQVLQSICINTATTPEQRASCWSPRP